MTEEDLINSANSRISVIKEDMINRGMNPDLMRNVAELHATKCFHQMESAIWRHTIEMISVLKSNDL